MGKQLTAELLNDKIVSLRKVVKIAERNLTEKINRNLEASKNATDVKKVRRAGRMKEEKAYITNKKVDADEVSKFALINTKPLVELNIQPNTVVHDRVLYKLATEKILLDAIDKIREDFPNWAKEVPFHLQRLGKRRVKTSESELEETLAGVGKKKASADSGPAAKKAKVVLPESDEEESEDEDIEVDEDDEGEEAEDDEVEAEDEDESEEEVAAPRGNAGTDSDDDEELPHSQLFAKVQRKKLTPATDSSAKNTKSKAALGLIEDMAEEEDMDMSLFEDAMFGAEDSEDELVEAESEDASSVELMEVDMPVKKPIAARALKEINSQKGKDVPAKGAKNVKGDSTAFVKKVKLDDLARAKAKLPEKKPVKKGEDTKKAASKNEKSAKKFLAQDSDESEESEEEEEETPAKKQKPVQKKGFWKGKVSDDEEEEEDDNDDNDDKPFNRNQGNRGRGGFNQGRGRGRDNRGNFRGRGSPGGFRGRGGDSGGFRGRGSPGGFRGRGGDSGGFRGRGSPGGFRGRGGDSGGFRGRGSPGGFRGRGGDSGGFRGRGSPGGGFRGRGENRGRGGNFQRGGRFNANEEKVHPSWAAKQQQRANQGGTPQGKRIVFDD